MRNLLISLKKIVKINLTNLTTKNKKNSLFIFLLTALIGSSFLWAKSYSIEFPPLDSLTPFTTQNKKGLSSFEDKLKDLPIAKTAMHEAGNDWATAILIPQYHRYPGSSGNDPINDSAERTQKQIYQIIPQINKQYGAQLIMIEGELYGEVPYKKIADLDKKIKERNKLVSECETLKKHLNENGVTPREEKLLNKIEQTIAKIDRNIILEGAPFKLKAEGKNLTLFGSENKDTQDQSRMLVKKYIYLQDRAKEISGQSRKLSSRGDESDKLFNDDTKSLLLKLLGSRDSLAAELKNFELTAKSNNDQKSLDLIEGIKITIENLEDNGKNPGLKTSEDSRADNPYNNVRSREKIEDMMQETEQQINEVIIDKRNKETAENFSRMLTEENQTAGILQYGAGHESGLIKELNRKGISVLVITPQEVMERDSR